MAKRYYSKRYTRKRRTKYLIIGLISLFITLVAVSAYSDIPQLEPIRKQIESFKSETGSFGLSIGDTGVVNEIAVTLVKCEIVDSYQYAYTWGDIETITPSTGAKFLFAYIKVENVGKVKKTFPKWSWRSYFLQSGESPIEISLSYGGELMEPHWIVCPSRGLSAEQHPYFPHYSWSDDSVYPGISEEGWVAFEVPAGIELDETTFKIRGLVWNLEEEKIEKKATIPLLR